MVKLKNTSIACTVLDCKWHRKDIVCKIADTIIEYYLDDGEECPYYVKKNRYKKKKERIK